MNHQDCVRQLKYCRKPAICTECHRRHLKHLLLSSHHEALELQQQPLFVRMGVALRRDPYQKALLTTGTLAVVVVAVALNFGIVDSDNTAHADELVHQAMTTVAALQPEERASLEADLQADIMRLLEEAYAAEDLMLLDANDDEVIDVRTAAFAPNYLLRPAAINATSADISTVDETADQYYRFDHDRSPATVRLLRYTDPQGNRVLFGVDESNR